MKTIDPRSNVNLNKPIWDYTSHAASYAARPNYAPSGIDELCRYVGAKSKDYIAADIGAGTANLTLMLLERNLECIAVEPNSAMRKIGMERTEGKRIHWMVGTGEETGLASASVDLFAMGSSFNTTDSAATLKEASRTLKKGGYFTCMWNHRDLEGDPIQKEMEQVIRRHVPNYSGGARRMDQTGVISESGLFKKVHFIEAGQKVQRTVDQYVEAWASVKNPYWDVQTPVGAALFGRIEADMRKALSSSPTLNLHYTTRIWTAQKAD